MAGEIISGDQCKTIFNRWATNRNATLKSSSIVPLNNQLDGLIGEQFFLKCIYTEAGEEDDIKFFVKRLSKDNPVMYEISREILAFEKEAFFYEKFVPSLQKCGLNCDYVAKSYLCESFSIVLEDLSRMSYRGTGKTAYLNSDHCRACLKTVARFHADGILLYLSKSEDLHEDEFKNLLQDNIFSKETKAMKYFVHSVEGLVEIANLIPENGFKQEDFKNNLVAVLGELTNVKKKIGEFRLTLTHNDLWSNNFLYQYDEDNKVKSCKIIDFQTVSLRPPAFDVIQFLLLNTRRKFRDEYLNEHLKYYYRCLSNFIGERGYNPSEVLNEDEFYTSCDVVMIPAKLLATVDRSLTKIPDEVFAAAARSEETFSNFIFEGRPKYMLDTFKSNDDYRDILTEDMSELRSMLSRR